MVMVEEGNRNDTLTGAYFATIVLCLRQLKHWDPVDGLVLSTADVLGFEWVTGDRALGSAGVSFCQSDLGTDIVSNSTV